MHDASTPQGANDGEPTAQDVAQGRLEVARILLDNHWLAHAEQQCQAALRLDGGTAELASALLRKIKERRDNPSALDLSQRNAPIAVCKGDGSIISTLHFRCQENERLKREAFRQAVTYIDVETSSQCNRRCLYCPNSRNDRLSFNRFMDDAVFIPFINNLRAIGYSRELHFVGFNEPLMHRENILGRVTLARRLLPRAVIVVFTNGDYLDRPYLEQLIVAGMNKMIISVHLAADKPYDDEAILERINRLALALNTPIVPTGYAAGAFIRARLIHSGADITIRQTDYRRYGSNRASSLENVGPQIDVRMAACLLPIHQFIVGHEGKVVPCCTMVSDDPRNAARIVGNIAEDSSIFDIYCGSAMVNWRRGLFNIGPKRPPCEKCADNADAPLLNAPALYEPWAHFVSLTPIEPALLPYSCNAG